jgi:uncharacterized membrane protein YgcG
MLAAGLFRILGSATHALAIWVMAWGNLAYVATAGAAETPTEPPTAAAGLSAAELEELLGPIALYPDELLAVVLPASTYPLQIVQASRFLEKHAADPELEPDEDWDESILALLNYPEVLDKMNEDLDWTWKLGEAVADQQADVLDAVQSFRAKVDAAGNLESNDKVAVVKETQEDQQVIIIESTSTEVIYVPTYQPSTVVVYQTSPYPYYYSSPYPYYYRPAAAFWTGMFVGAAVGWGMHWGWGGHHSSIDIDRNVNINVDRPTRPERPSERPGDRDRPDDRQRGGGDREQWKADKSRGKQSGARPGREAARQPGAGARPGAGTGSRPSAGARPATQPQKSARPSQAGSRDQSATSQRSSREASGRDITRGSGSQRSSRDSSLGHYGSGSRTRSYSSRGASSRGASRGGRGGGGRRR